MDLLHDSLRPKTQAGATSYHFLLEDATGFPSALPKARKIGFKKDLPPDFVLGDGPPARKIPNGRRSLTGLQPTSKGNHKGHFESALERDLYVQLEFDPMVQSWHPQPVRIPMTESRKPYCPDVGVEYLAYESSENSRPQWMLYEVKYAAELRERWREFRPSFKAALRFAKSRGWGFRILTERDIRTEHLFNAKFLLPYLLHPPAANWRKIMEFAEDVGRTSPQRIIRSLARDRWDQAALLTHVWTLIARRDLRCDLLKKMTMQSEVWIEQNTDRPR